MGALLVRQAAAVIRNRCSRISAGNPAPAARFLPVRAKYHALPAGIAIAVTPGVSPLACAIEHRFEEVCRAELVRLGRKTASLSAAHRDEVHAITVEVARAIAAHLASRLAPDTPAEVCNIIGTLFNLRPDSAVADVANRVPATGDGQITGRNL
jgi:hypothetical protein